MRSCSVIRLRTTASRWCAGLDAGCPGAPAGLVAGQPRRRPRPGDDDERAAAGGGEGRSSPVRPGAPRTSTGRSGSTVGPSEVTAMARSPCSHTRAPAAAGVRRRAGGRSRSGGRGGAGHATARPRAVSRRTSTVAGRNRPSTSATRPSASSSSPPSTVHVVARVDGVGPVGAADHARRPRAGRSLNQPAASPPTSRPKIGGSSKRGTHHQSIEPSGATSAARAGVADQPVVADRHRRAASSSGRRAHRQPLPRNRPSTAP